MMREKLLLLIGMLHGPAGGCAGRFSGRPSGAYAHCAVLLAREVQRWRGVSLI
jgi:hypothetical protein